MVFNSMCCYVQVQDTLVMAACQARHVSLLRLGCTGTLRPQMCCSRLRAP